MADLMSLEPDEVTGSTTDPALPDWALLLVSRARQAAESGQTVTLSAEERMLTPEQMGRRMGMHRSTVVRKIESGEIRAVMVGTHHRIPYSEFLRFREESLNRMTQLVAPEIEQELFGDE
ncbi:excisionase family DNA-binding protein [Myceligenerans crystallogenes]|uniref:Helix-turn-helix domain-containing protein n=1 Tax=Myceligenerans crystallogenes TaxID=316335 RepID=A0ABN2NC36_9MICO